MKKHAVIIIPTYNERDNISRVVAALAEVFAHIKDWQMSILVVDDTSPDKTYEVVKILQKEYSFLYLFMNKKKSGLGGAYLAGMKHAFGELNADIVFEFDADLSHDPKILPQMLDKIDEGYDLVLGSRYIPGGSMAKEWGLHRKFLSYFGNLFINVVFFDFSVRDWTAGYRAITKKTYLLVHPQLHSDRFSGYTFQIGFLYNTLRQGLKVAEVPYVFVDRTIGESKIGAEYMKNTMIYILKMRWNEVLQSRVFKFVVVGGIGAIIQLSSLQLWRTMLPFQIAFFASIETAIISNFLLSNLWTFADRKLQRSQVISKFIAFNIASGGSIAIQQLLALVGEFSFGIVPLFIIPFTAIPFDSGTLYAVIGIFIGMFWNFFAYSRIIWKKNK